MKTGPAWIEAYKLKNVQYKLAGSVFILALVLYFYSGFLTFIESREGFVFNDPVLKLFTPVDLTWLIFLAIYLSLLSGIIILIRNPVRLMLALQVYTVLILVRMIAMYSVPFNPPLSMIPLNDPFVQFFGTGKLLTKDLFFSGHTATLFLLFLVIDKKPYKQIFLFLTMLVGVCVILQHVHYFIDVFSAPFFTYGCYILVKRVRERVNLFNIT
jgi:membrane-associated phospholipid phosphatase